VFSAFNQKEKKKWMRSAFGTAPAWRWATGLKYKRRKRMAFMKRIFLFMMVNLLVVATISIVLNLLNVRPYLTAHGLDYRSLAIFCLVWGMGGALISLAISRIMAKMALGVKVIDPATATGRRGMVGSNRSSSGAGREPSGNAPGGGLSKP
jgi:FtsH-binding integral membrane protein